VKKDFFKFSLAAVLALMLVPQVQAASVTVALNQSDVDAFLPDGLDYMQVTISDGVEGAIDFSVEISPVLTDINAGSNFGILYFGFNFGGLDGSTAEYELPTDWFVNDDGPQSFGGFGTFDAVLQGTEFTRQQTLNFSVSNVEGQTIQDYLSLLSGGEANEGNVLFAAKLAGFSLDVEAAANQSIISLDGFKPGETIVPSNARFGGPTSVVPLPPAMALAFSAMAVLGFTGVRRRKALAAK